VRHASVGRPTPDGAGAAGSVRAVDWGVAEYEHTAADLVPVAEAVVEAAGVGPGHRVLDVACGTGNAALAAAARGATVAGIDAAPRLLEVAAGRAREAGVDADWRQGDLQTLPYEDGAFDAALSVFGVIFAADGRRAAAELLRVTKPGGTVVVTSWPPRGALAEVVRISREAAAGDAAAQPAVDAVDWGSEAQLRDLFATASGVTVEERTVPFTAASPRDYVDRQDRHHPAWHAIKHALDADRYARLLDESTELLATGNRDPAGFRLDVPYLLTLAHI
jgi:ubiquinone/menaquinone biosynthesis C-methylase UbiE